MTTADPPIRIRKPFFTNSNHRVDLIFFSDESYTTRLNITGKTVKVLIDDGTTRTYTVSSHDDAANGETHVTLTGSNHVTAGDADVQVLVDDIPKRDYIIEFRTRLA